MKTQTRAVPNLLLRRQREARHWTQTELARMLGTTYLSISRWESGTTSPSMYYRKRLCELFDLPSEELGLASSKIEVRTSTEGDEVYSPERLTSPIWNVPYRRNPFFTGREHLLARLYTLLHSGRATALSQAHALSGLGGIGKTQTAVEYAYRHRHDYQAVLWIRSETYEALSTDLMSIAELLNLREKGEQDQSSIVTAVTRWLNTHAGWLLILDNVEHISLVEDIAPLNAQGHILLTTRLQSTGAFAQKLDVERLAVEEGALFLLRRIKQMSPDEPLEGTSPTRAQEAKALCRLLDGLPLALDQAGAYTEEIGCSLSDYLQRYQARRAHLLRRRGQQGNKEHPASVSTTFSLSFEKVERASPVAAELLRLCAFLDADAIPEEIITDGLGILGPVLETAAIDPFALDDALAVLRTFSLLQRTPENKMFSIHRLVQAVLQDAMDESIRSRWATQAVQVVNHVFPAADFAHWQHCQRLLPQAQACAELIEQHHFAFPEAAQLLHRAGWYLQERALYTQAEILLQRALTIREQVLGSQHADTASTLDSLAILYFFQGRYTEADALFQRALSIREQVLGPEHTATASTLDSLGLLYKNQGRYTEAEALFQRALTIEEKVLGPEHADTGSTLNNLAILYYAQGRYRETHPLYQRLLVICEQTLGPEHSDTAIVLDNLAQLYHVQGEYEQAEELFQRSIAIEEKVLGREHPNTATTLNNLGHLYHTQARYEEAETLVRQALVVKENAFGYEHPHTAITCDLLAYIYKDQGRYTEAESLFQQALTIKKKTLGPEHPHVATTLDRLAQLYLDREDYDLAESLFQQALALREKVLPPEHPDIAITLANLARLYQKQGRNAEAKQFSQRALAIRELQLGSEHPQTIATREFSIALQTQEQVAWRTEEETSCVVSPHPTLRASVFETLTAREIDVLRLLAQGKTDRQIAEQLVISPRTVNTHVTALYQKMDVTSRSAATRYALEHSFFSEA